MNITTYCDYAIVGVSSQATSFNLQRAKAKYFVGQERAFKSVFKPPTIQRMILEADPRFMAARNLLLLHAKLAFEFLHAS